MSNRVGGSSLGRDLTDLSAAARRVKRKLAGVDPALRFVAELERAIYEGRASLPDDLLATFPPLVEGAGR